MIRQLQKRTPPKWGARGKSASKNIVASQTRTESGTPAGGLSVCCVDASVDGLCLTRFVFHRKKGWVKCCVLLIYSRDSGTNFEFALLAIQRSELVKSGRK